MIPKPNDILLKFKSSLQDSKALFFHCINKVDRHTDAGVEAAFLQFVTSWEAFLENATLSFLCGEVPLTVPPALDPKFTLSDFEDARTIVYNGQAYADWLKTELLINRFKTFFKTDANNENRLIKAINSNLTVLRHIAMIRNEIAHSSFSSSKKIKSVVYNSYSPTKNFSRPSEYLKEFAIGSTTKLNFEYYIEMLELSATQIIDK